MPLPPYVPGHSAVQPSGQTNPLHPGPDMRATSQNPGSLLPAVGLTRGVESFSDKKSVRFDVLSPTLQRWFYTTPVFDLRPGLSASLGAAQAAHPLNHEAALGQSFYLLLQIESISGAFPPAAIPNLQAFYYEEGHVGISEGRVGTGGQLRRLTQLMEVTSTLQSGGTITTEPFAASVIQITPCQPSLRFWKVGFFLQINDNIDHDYDLRMWAMIH